MSATGSLFAFLRRSSSRACVLIRILSRAGFDSVRRRPAKTFQGHEMYGHWLSYRDFEQILLLALGASGSDVRRLWPT